MIFLAFFSNIILLCTANEKNLTCPSGFVQCVDGKCEPYESLCEDGGIVTVIFSTNEATSSSPTKHLASSVSKGSFETSLAVTESTQAATTQTVATTTSVVLATDSSGHEICLDGWEMCLDGTCEPFHWLCTEHDGSANFTTFKVSETTQPTPVDNIQPIVTTVRVESNVEPTELTTTTEMFTETTVTDIVPHIVTSSTGACPNGFVQCADGTCESFEALCGEGGVITVTFQTNLTTTGRTSQISESSFTSKLTSESLSTLTTVSSSTTTFAVVTDSNGKEVCADGWEQCKDGTCEPFHWLCTEHDGSAPIIG